jgi:hypothetical protein
MPWSESTPTVSRGASSRDVQAAAILGWFHLGLAMPVLAGVAFAELTIDRVLNVLAAMALAGVGAFFLRWAHRLARKASGTPAP